MHECFCCEDQFEEIDGELDYGTGKFYCTDCYRSNEYQRCSECESIKDFLERDGRCEACSPDDYWMGEDPDFMDSYDPDTD